MNCFSDSSMAKDSRLSNVRMGWCGECRRAVSRLEDTMPGITAMVPGYTHTMVQFIPIYTICYT
jgi:hypothetical protein